MGLFSWLRSDKKETKGLEFDAQGNVTFIPLNYVNSMEGHPSLLQLETKAFGGNAIVYMVANRIAQLVATVDFEIANPDSVRKEAVPQRLASLIESPSEYLTWQEFIYQLALNYLVGGNAFVAATTDGIFEDPAELVCPRSSNVQIMGEASENITGYSITHFDRTWMANPSNVLHIRNPNITKDTHFGLSPLEPLAEIWKGNNALAKNERLIHERNGVNGVVYSKAGRPLSDEERENVQRAVNRNMSGQHNAGLHYFSSTELGYTQLGSNLKDLMGDAAYMRQLRVICATYNVPSQVFGDVNLTYANMEQAQVAMWSNAVWPLAKRLYKELSLWLVQGKYRLKMKFVLDKSGISELNKADQERVNNLLAQVQAGILTANEAREMLHPELKPLTQ